MAASPRSGPLTPDIPGTDRAPVSGPGRFGPRSSDRASRPAVALGAAIGGLVGAVGVVLALTPLGPWLANELIGGPARLDATLLGFAVIVVGAAIAFVAAYRPPRTDRRGIRRNVRSAAEGRSAGGRPSAPPAANDALARFARGRAWVLSRLERDGPKSVRELEREWPTGAAPADLADWIAALVAEGALSTTVGADGVPRFARAARPAGERPPKVTVDPRALEAAIERSRPDGLGADGGADRDAGGPS